MASFLTGPLACFCVMHWGSPGTPAPVGTSEKPLCALLGSLAQGHVRGRAGPGLLAGVHE